MIKNFFNIIIIITVFSSCKKQDDIGVNQLISNYNLESFGRYKNENRQENYWYSKDSLLRFVLYENNKTKYFLYIVQNKNKDTIFKFFDSTSVDLKIRDFFKFKSNYFITLWNPSPSQYVGRLNLSNSKNDIYESLYRYDSLNIYLVDSISNHLKKINKPQIKSISDSFKAKYNLRGEFEVIKEGSKIRLIKDILQNKKILYQSAVGLEIVGKKNPHLSPYFFNKSVVKLDQNNFSTDTEKFLTSKSLKGDIKYFFKYNREFSNTGISKINFIFHQNKENYVLTPSLDSLYILDDDYQIRNINRFDSFHVEPFKYVNGEYFFYIHQISLEYWSGSFPVIYHIDTVNWKIRRVLPLKENKRFKKLKTTHQIEILSNIYKSSLSYILKDFEIIKSENEYRLIKKED